MFVPPRDPAEDAGLGETGFPAGPADVSRWCGRSS